MRQYDLEEREIKTAARKKLFAGEVVMKEGAEVRTYIRDFKEVARDAADMAEIDLIMWFKQGLTRALGARCAAQPLNGRPWQSLDALIEYTYGQEDSIKR